MCPTIVHLLSIQCICVCSVYTYMSHMPSQCSKPHDKPCFFGGVQYPQIIFFGVPQYLGHSWSSLSTRLWTNSGSKGYHMNVPLWVFPTGHSAKSPNFDEENEIENKKKLPKPEHLAGVFADIMFIQVVSQRQSPWNRSFAMAYLNLGLQKRAHFSGHHLFLHLFLHGRRFHNKTWYFTNPKGLATGNPPAPWKALRSLRALDSTATSEVKDLQTSNSVAKTMP